jgi:poly-beta-hydroxyalkanoate depolymerase
MLYQAYQAHTDIMIPVRALAGMAMASSGWRPVDNTVLRNLTAAYELIARSGLTHHRPPFGIDRIMVGNREVEVTEEATLKTLFATLLHFSWSRAGAAASARLAAVRHWRRPAQHRAHDAARARPCHRLAKAREADP